MKKHNLLIPLILSVIFLHNCDSAFEPLLKGKKVILLAPLNNLVISDTLQTFYWELLDGASKYQLQLVSPKFDSIVRLIADTIILSNRLEMDLKLGSYQWRVKGINFGSESSFSDTWNLKIQ